MVSMSLYKFVLRLFVYVVVVCPVIWSAHAHDRSSATHGQEHIHYKEPPCAVCPRVGRCVPKVQCPAHMRVSSYNPACHLDSAAGVCCFTGSGHAAESERHSRAATAISKDDIKTSHSQSRQKLSLWITLATKLLEHSMHTIVNTTSPSYGHHLPNRLCAPDEYVNRRRQLQLLVVPTARTHLLQRAPLARTACAHRLRAPLARALCTFNRSVVSHDERAATLGRGGLLNLFTAQELKGRQAISEDELALGLTDHTDGPFCPPQPSCSTPGRYRSIGGECNNPTSSTWGAVLTGFERLLPPDYSDGTWAMRTAKSGLSLPSARAVSSALLLDGSRPSSTHNMMFMQFGQFIAHDISAGVVFTADNGSAISCCMNDGEDVLPPALQHFACAPIVVAPDDQFYGQFKQKCINFVRTQIAPASDCSVGYAKQMNGATHYPDLSHLYGSSEEKLSSLRDAGGLLKTFNDYGRELPPLTERKECLAVREGAACFESGDNHGNQIISLTVLHTIFTREHNRVARALSALNPGWNEDTVFWETRRILQAEFQHVIYNEWLPLLLGPEIINTFKLSPSAGYSSSYDPHTNPSLSAEFSTAAMRFGHSVVDGRIVIQGTKMGGVYETISIPELMFQPTRMRLRHFIDRLLIGLSSQPMQSVDPFITEGLSRYMFHGGNPYGVDLAAINIQRGRDHGLNSYNQYRKLIGLEPYTEFQQFAPSAAQRLVSVYEGPEDIDLWVGGLLEEPVDGGIVGPTFANIIADQFARHKKGDRFYYEYGPDVNPEAFTPSQLEEIKKVTLSCLICNNRDGVELLSQPPSAFLRADLFGNEPVPCDSPGILSMDLSKFNEM